MVISWHPHINQSQGWLDNIKGSAKDFPPLLSLIISSRRILSGHELQCVNKFSRCSRKENLIAHHGLPRFHHSVLAVHWCFNPGTRSLSRPDSQRGEKQMIFPWQKGCELIINIQQRDEAGMSSSSLEHPDTLQFYRWDMFNITGKSVLLYQWQYAPEEVYSNTSQEDNQCMKALSAICHY